MSSKKVGKFIVSDTDKGIVFNDIDYDWKYSISIDCPSYPNLKYNLENMEDNDLDMLILTMYNFTNLIMQDAGLVTVVNQYLSNKLNPKVDEVTEKEDLENLNSVKDASKTD